MTFIEHCKNTISSSALLLKQFPHSTSLTMYRGITKSGNRSITPVVSSCYPVKFDLFSQELRGPPFPNICPPNLRVYKGHKVPQKHLRKFKCQGGITINQLALLLKQFSLSLYGIDFDHYYWLQGVIISIGQKWMFSFSRINTKPTHPTFLRNVVEFDLRHPHQPNHTKFSSRDEEGIGFGRNSHRWWTVRQQGQNGLCERYFGKEKSLKARPCAF